MPQYALELRNAIEKGTALLERIGDEESRRPLKPGKWSAREVIGHLVDSASNNHQRFVVRLMETIPADERIRRRTRHNLDELAWKPVHRDTPATLDYFMEDYVGHLKHHLNQIFAFD